MILQHSDLWEKPVGWARVGTIFSHPTRPPTHPPGRLDFNVCVCVCVCCDVCVSVLFVFCVCVCNSSPNQPQPNPNPTYS